MIKPLLRKIFKSGKFKSDQFWEQRYSRGGNSGDGSYGRLSEFKAEVINHFLEKMDIRSTIELGCGDGHQLSLINYKSYTGLDVSDSAIDRCRQKFKEHNGKTFFVYHTGDIRSISPADLSLSLDVIYHIVEEEIYKQYLHDLFSLSQRYVIIYSTDYSEKEADHIFHREFTKYVGSNFEQWELIERIENPYPGTGEQESLANFFFYQKLRVSSE